MQKKTSALRGFRVRIPTLAQECGEAQPRLISVAALLSCAAIATLALLSLSDASGMYNIGGAQWDFLSHWLYARALLMPDFYTSLYTGHFAAAVQYGNLFYFEIVRAPLTGLMMVPFAAFGSMAIPAYVAFALALLLVAVLCLSRQLRMQPVLLSLLFLTPYVALFLTLLNGTEVISIALLLFTVVLLLRKDWKAGALLALAALAKYPNLIFMPLILLVPKGQRLRALAAFAAVTAPWLAFNAIWFGNPLFSYAVSLGAYSSSGPSASHFAAVAPSLWITLTDLVPAALALLASLLLLWGSGRKRFAAWLRESAASVAGGDMRYGVALSLLALGAFAWAAVSSSGTIDNLPRLGYLLYTGLAILIALAISDSAMRLRQWRRAYAYVIVVLFAASVAVLVTWFPYTGYAFSGSSGAVISQAENAMAVRGIDGCNVISNSWVYLIYDGYKAHFPYYYNSTVERYPIVFFTDTGTNQSQIDFANVTARYNYSGFFLAFPANHTC